MITSCAISCFEISCDFVVRMMTRQNRKLNETYLKSMFDWDSAESSVAQEVTPIPCRGINTHPHVTSCATDDSAESQSNIDLR